MPKKPTTTYVYTNRMESVSVNRFSTHAVRAPFIGCPRMLVINPHLVFSCYCCVRWSIDLPAIVQHCWLHHYYSGCRGHHHHHHLCFCDLLSNPNDADVEGFFFNRKLSRLFPEKWWAIKIVGRSKLRRDNDMLFSNERQATPELAQFC